MLGALDASVFQQALFKDYLQGRQSRGARDQAAAEGGLVGGQPPSLHDLAAVESLLIDQP